MATGNFVSYLRVSTTKQGATGLGIDGQREMVARYLNGGDWHLLKEFVEVESGKKSDRERPELAAALALCRKERATLIVGKIDRLSRDAAFLMTIRNSGVDIRAVDMPEAGTLEWGIRAVFAQHEREEISRRTKAALAIVKARGVKLGVAGPLNLRANVEQRQANADLFAAKLAGQIAGFKARGLSQRQQVAELNQLGIATPRGGSWTLSQWQRVLARV